VFYNFNLLDEPNDSTDISKNIDHWNKRVATHMFSKMYNLDAFLGGKTSLNKTELEELGSVKGKSLCHLQCHFGQDTLSWAREGAKVTGLDFSDLAVEAAKDLSIQTGIPAKFVCANVLDAAKAIDSKFDSVFTSYGTIGWIPELETWAKQIYQLLNQNGVFYMVDFHPVVWMFNNDLTEIEYSYFNVQKIEETEIGTYADKEADIVSQSVGWNHPISEIVSALINAGLKLEFIHEFGFTWYDIFPDLEPRTEGGFTHKKYGEKMPMMYSIKCTKL
jgi:SAM-dependent methyltransferase